MSTSKDWIYIGDDEKYRYALGEPGTYNLVIIGLNPSTATPDKPDPTIKRVRKIVEESQYDGWIMINLCALRTPKPDELPNELDDEISRKNLEVLSELKKKYYFGAIYAAWGTNIEKRYYLLDELQKILDTMPDISWYTRGVTKYGHPKHPLYVPYDQEMNWFAAQDYIWRFE